MAVYATTDDLADRLGRELNEAEGRMAEALLVDASDKVDKVTPTPGTVTARAVVCAMVLRVLRNPEGREQLTIDDLGFRLSAIAASGQLRILDEERAELLASVVDSGGVVVATGAFTIRPAYVEPTRWTYW